MLEFSEYSKSSPCSNPPENTSDIDMVSAMAETKIVHALSLSKKGTLQRQSVIIEKLGFKWHTRTPGCLPKVRTLFIMG